MNKRINDCKSFIMIKFTLIWLLVVIAIIVILNVWSVST
jgi:Tfp pilus assembly protein PilE